MPQSKKIHIAWYMFADYIAAVLAWIVMYFTRRLLLHEPVIINHEVYLNNRFWLGISLIPVCWLMFYGMVGSYNSLYKKSLLDEFTRTFVFSLIGCTVIFFSIVINDPQTDYRYYYKTYFTFLSVQFIFTIAGRWVLLHLVKKQLKEGSVQFKTLLVVNNPAASRIYRDTKEGLRSTGYHYTGYVSNETSASNGIARYLRKSGSISELEHIIDQEDIELVVIAMEKPEKEQVEKIIDRLSDKDVEIKIVPDLLDILSGSVKTSNVFGAVLTDIQTSLIPAWQQNIKRLADVIISLLGMIFLSPLLLYAALRVKFSSPRRRYIYTGKNRL